MKKIHLKVIASTLLFSILISCQKEKFESVKPSVEQPIYDTVKRDAALNSLAKAIAHALKEPKFRKTIKSEALKQFDGDYDVLYRTIENKDLDIIKLESGEANASVSDLISSYLLKLEGKEKESVSNQVKVFDNLQIAVPVNCEEWNPENFTPVVAVLTSDYKEGVSTNIKAYDHEGNVVWLDAKNKPKEPVIVLGESERVDKQRRVRVTKDGIVLPEDQRVSVEEALKNAEEELVKSLTNNQSAISKIAKNSIIEVVDDLNTIDLPQQSFLNVPSPLNTSKQGNDKVALRTKAIPTVPTNLTVTRGDARTFHIRWDPVIGATGYIITRYSIQDGSLNFTVSGGNNNLLTQSNLTAALEYTYYVRAFNSEGTSGYSTGVSNLASYRSVGGTEKIEKIYCTSSYYSVICGWPEGDMELDIMRVQGHATSSPESKMTDVPKISKSSINGAWYVYNGNLFNWYTQDGGTVYSLSFVEDDGEQNLKASFTIDGKYELKSAKGGTVGINGQVKWDFSDYDEKIGSMEVHWWDEMKQVYEPNPTRFKVVLGFYHAATPCPYIGTYEGSNCQVGTPPSGTSAFIHSGFYYYTPVNGNQCPYPGSFFDGANCQYKRIPSGAHAFIYSNYWYAKPGY